MVENTDNMGSSEVDVVQKEIPQNDSNKTIESDESAFSVLIDTPSNGRLQLDHVSLSDTVFSIRQLLQEIPALACYSSYHLELKDSKNDWIPLNDYVELSEYPDLEKNSILRLVVDRYDSRKSRAHVRRLREVLSNPPIPPVSGIRVVSETEETPKEVQKHNDEPETESQVQASSKTDSEGSKVNEEEHLKKLREIHENLELISVPLETSLSQFYKPTKSKKSQPTSTKLPECLKSIAFSGYNPPPGPRRLSGDLFYLEVTFLDETVLHITSHISGFYVNRSSMYNFNPTPHKNACRSHLLLDVLRKASPSFSKQFDSLLSEAAELAQGGLGSIDSLLGSVQNFGGNLQWNTPSVENEDNPTGQPNHEFNLNRAEDELCSTFGMDERGILRDWNEEYQCCKELPASTLKEEVVRNRVMYKITKEFVDAATHGARAIVEGQIPPINPMDPEKAHVYVYNNIFFSLAMDGNNAFRDIGGDESASASANHDLQGVLAFNQADIQGLHTLATAVVDYIGVRLVAQSVIPGILQGEAASKLVYGSVDGGKTIASNPKMHALMCEAGKKLNIAEREVKPLGYDEGTNMDDANQNNIFQKNGEAGTSPVKICGPVEAKGILGSDGRYYVLDLVRITPRDATFYKDSTCVDSAEENKEESNPAGLSFENRDESYTALLRPELVQLYSVWKQNQSRREILNQKKNEGVRNDASDGTNTEEKPTEEKSTKEKPSKEKALEEKSTQEEIQVDPVYINPNVFMKYKCSTDEDIAKEDEQLAHDASSYLQNVVIPALLSDVRRGAVTPIDGNALTDIMHSCGINMRYLGRLAELTQILEESNGISKYVLELLETEMIARVVKHMMSDIFTDNPSIRCAPGAMVTDFLNALFGNIKKDSQIANESSEKPGNADTKGKKGKKSKKSRKSNKKASTLSLEYAPVTLDAENQVSLCFDTKSLWNEIESKVHARFSYKLILWSRKINKPVGTNDSNVTRGNDSVNRTHKLPLLRRICQRVGLRVLSRDYDFEKESPFANDDITDIVPVVKHSLPKHPLPKAKQLLERGRLHLNGGSLSTAYDHLQEAASLLYQVCGAAHEDSALCCSSLATVLYHAGDIPAAILQQQRALALYTQVLGIDHHDTAFAHANLALFLHANAQTDDAVIHLQRAIYLLQLAGGPHLSELGSLYFKLGMMYQDVGHVTLALLCHRESLRRGDFDRLQVANTLHQMALACSMAKGYREALAYEKKVYQLYKEIFGDNDPRVLESSKYMAAFTSKAVAGAKDRQQLDAVAAADAIADELVAELKISDDNSSNKKGKKGSKTKGK